MRSIISANLFPRAAAAFVVGGLAVLVVHQPVVAMLHALAPRRLHRIAFEQHGLGAFRYSYR